MKLLITSGIILFLITSFVGCIKVVKNPMASFQTDKEQYNAEEIIHLKNTSKDSDSYKWIMPDGTTSASADADYVLDSFIRDTSLTITLEAYRKQGNKSNKISKTVSVKSIAGDVMFWQLSGSQHGYIGVQINGINQLIFDKTNSAPDCNHFGSALFHLKPGSYDYTAGDGIDHWNGTIVITRDQCLKILLQ